MNRPLRVNMISESAFTVQGHGVHTAFVENLNCLGNRQDVDVMPNTNRVADIVHVHTVGPYSLSKLLGSKSGKVVSAHVTPDSFVGSLVGAKYWYRLASWYLRWFYNRADAVLAVSQEVINQLKEMGVVKPIFLVPNTIDTFQYKHTPDQRKAIRQRLGIDEEAFVVLSNGQVQPRKRIDTFIACAKALPDYRFVWVGGIPFKRFAASYKQMEQVFKTAPSNVVVTGVIPHEAVLDYYFAADLFFLPSVQETFGIVIVEAAAAGLPILLRDIEQYRQTFGEGYVAAQEEDFDQLISKFATDTAYYRKWQEAAKKIAEQYDSKAGAKRLLEVYRKVLEAKGH